MGRMKEHPRYHVLSFRVGDDEKKRIEGFVDRSGKAKGSALRELVLDGIGALKRRGKRDA